MRAAPVASPGRPRTRSRPHPRGARAPRSSRGTEGAAALHRAIDRLSPKLAEVVRLRYPGQLSYEEIGELLGLPPGTVRSRLNRAHAALRAQLGASLDEDPGIL